MESFGAGNRYELDMAHNLTEQIERIKNDIKHRALALELPEKVFDAYTKFLLIKLREIAETAIAAVIVEGKENPNEFAGNPTDWPFFHLAWNAARTEQLRRRDAFSQ